MFTTVKGKNKSVKLNKYQEEQSNRLDKYYYKYNYGNKYVSNTSTLYIKAELTTNKLNTILNKVIDDLIKDNYLVIRPDIKINSIKLYGGVFSGIHYVDIDNPVLYYILLGKNPDGSERVEEKVKEEKIEFNWGMSFNWADECVDIEVIQLEPIIDLSNYTCKEIYVAKAIVPKKESTRKLYVHNIPNDFLALHSLFDRYGRSQNKETYQRNPYPKIYINENNTATVKYDNVFDCKFALLMLKKVELKVDNKLYSIRVKEFKE